MSLRQYLILMAISTALCWIAWGMVLVNVDPFTAPLSGFLFFYTSLFLALIGTVSIIAFGLYLWLKKTELPLYRFVQLSFRDGVGTGIAVILLLVLQSEGLLRWWSVLLFLIFILITIGFAVSTRRPKARTTTQPPSFV